MPGYTRQFVVAKTTDIALTSLYFFVFAVTASVALNFMTEFYDAYTRKDKTATTKKIAYTPLL